MIDLPNRPQPRFPAHLETQIYQAICERLSQLDVSFGYACAACGSDILFLEAILERKGEIHLVLPYSASQFIPDCVDIIPDSNWRERFTRLLDQATEVNVACNGRYEENTSLYQYTHRLLHGLGKIRSQQLHTELVPLAVWDGKPGDSLGGTATMVSIWQQWGYEVEIINPQSLATAAVAKPISLPATKPEKTDASRPIMALLFADVVKYSRLSEEQIGLYVEHFLGAIADLETQKGYQPALKNTWGDALYYVFPKVAEAGNFALDMCNLIQRIDWASIGLPEDLNIRVSLHAGPVYPYTNPITKKTSYSGSHVSYAARIEPITPPGQVYASQEFTAVICAEEVKDFICDYVGKTPLAKGFGTFPTYHVHRR